MRASYRTGALRSPAAGRALRIPRRLTAAVATVLSVTATALPSAATAVDLASVQKAAAGRDPSIASATANRDAAFENIAIARSRLMPTVSLSSTNTHLNQTTTQGDTVREFSGGSRSTSLQFRQPLLRMRERVGLSIGQLQAEWGAAKLVTALADVKSRASGAWIDVLISEANRGVFERALEKVEASAAQEKRRFLLGDGTRDLMVEAAAQEAQVRAQLAEAELDLQAKMRALNELTGLNLTQMRGFHLPALSSLDLLGGSRERFLEHALEVNSELEVSRIESEINTRKVSQAGADHYPTVDLIASTTRAANDMTNTLGLSYENRQIGLQFQVPIYSGGGIAASERQAASVLAASLSDREAMIQRVRIQVALDWNTMQGQRERAGGARELVEATREQRRAVEMGIRVGMKTWADLGSTDLLLIRRETDFVALLGAALKTQVKLLALLPPDDPEWVRWTDVMTRIASR